MPRRAKAMATCSNTRNLPVADARILIIAPASCPADATSCQNHPPYRFVHCTRCYSSQDRPNAVLLRHCIGCYAGQCRIRTMRCVRLEHIGNDSLILIQWSDPVVSG